MSEQITIRVKDKDAFKRNIAELEVEYDTFLNAYSYEIHTAMAELAFDNPDQFRAKLREVRGE